MTYYPTFLENPQEWFSKLQEELEPFLGQHTILVYNKELPEPRLGAFFSHDGSSGYTYSKRRRPTYKVQDCPTLERMRQLVSEKLGVEFNSCLCNWYRNGKDCIGWHSDDEKDLKTSDIASVSLGAVRDFYMRPKGTTRGRSHEYKLASGSLFYMFGDCQKRYQHTVPKRAKVIEPRLNITFRVKKKCIVYSI
jgi:alkylated DNA repair dioxygenase AlkB